MNSNNIIGPDRLAIDGALSSYTPPERVKSATGSKIQAFEDEDEIEVTEPKNSGRKNRHKSKETHKNALETDTCDSDSSGGTDEKKRKRILEANRIKARERRKRQKVRCEEDQKYIMRVSSENEKLRRENEELRRQLTISRMTGIKLIPGMEQSVNANLQQSSVTLPHAGLVTDTYPGALTRRQLQNQQSQMLLNNNASLRTLDMISSDMPTSSRLLQRNASGQAVFSGNLPLQSTLQDDPSTPQQNRILLNNSASLRTGDTMTSDMAASTHLLQSNAVGHASLLERLRLQNILQDVPSTRQDLDQYLNHNVNFSSRKKQDDFD